MTQTKYLTHKLLCRRRIEKTEESLISSQLRGVGRIHLGGAVRTSNLWRRSRDTTIQKSKKILTGQQMDKLISP